MSRTFMVKRDDLTHSRLNDSAPLSAAADEVVLAIESFALTANNITYAVAGNMIGYWKFFPSADGWGQIPVWGIGKVVDSGHSDISPGTRFYGYFPMAEQLRVQPVDVNPRGFKDGAAHRAELPPVYNQYSAVNAENGFTPGFDDHAMVYRPLFTTSFVLDDYLADNKFFDTKSIILGSASSKTAFGLAFMLHQRSDIEVIGLTSDGNRKFVEKLGLYNTVLTYDAVESLPFEPSVYVDMAGNRQVLGRIHHHLQDNLKCSCGVGITHWDARDGEDPATLPGAKPEMFFAPSQIMKRNQELGAAQYQALLGAATQAFFARVDNWVQIERHPFEEVQAVYDLVRNGPPADRAYVIAA
ncbi:MAG: DUF2855 family protein [Pseudomonadota bacterium]